MVRRGSLDGGVDGGAFRRGFDGLVGGIDFRDNPSAPQERFRISLLFRLARQVFHEGLDARELEEVIFNQGGGLAAGAAQPLGESEGGNAVDDAEVHRLGRAPHDGVHLVAGNAVHAGGRFRVDVPAFLEGLAHGGISGHGRP